jgi:hypothetical protein
VPRTTSPPSGAPPASRAGLWLLAPFLVGTVLRLWNLPAQILGGDEMHAVRATLNSPSLGELLVTYRQADNCIPLSALYRLVVDAGGSLSEWVLRLPVLASGLLLLALAPLWIERRLGRHTAALFAWLLAVSPMLVLYSRIARSYLPMLALGGGAVAAFEAFWRTRRPRWAAAYAVLAALAVWFHLGAGPFVAAPLAFAAADVALRPGGREERLRRLAALAGAGLGFAAACALFLLPARESLAAVVAAKHRAQAIPPRTVLDMMLLQAGTGHSGVAALFWGLALGGLALLAIRRPRCGLYVLAVAAGQIAGILLLSPVGLAHPWVLDRYLLPVLPCLLLGIAYGLAEGGWPARAVRSEGGESQQGEEAGAERETARDEARSSREGRESPALAAAALRGLGLAGAAAFVSLLLVAGPFADRGFRRSSFMHSDDMAGIYLPRASLPEESIPALYRRLAAAGDGGAVIEYPWLFLWRFRAFYIYQEIHGRRVLVATPQRLARRREVALANALPAEPAAFCGSGARYLIVHLHVAREDDRVRRPRDKPAPALTRQLRRSLRLSGKRMSQELKRRWGPPFYADQDVEAWDLARVCRSRAGA